MSFLVSIPTGNGAGNETHRFNDYVECVLNKLENEKGGDTGCTSQATAAKCLGISRGTLSTLEKFGIMSKDYDSDRYVLIRSLEKIMAETCTENGQNLEYDAPPIDTWCQDLADKLKISSVLQCASDPIKKHVMVVSRNIGNPEDSTEWADQLLKKLTSQVSGVANPSVRRAIIFRLLDKREDVEDSEPLLKFDLDEEQTARLEEIRKARSLNQPEQDADNLK